MNEDATDSATRPEDEPFTLRPPDPTQLAWLRDRIAGNERLLASQLRRYREQEGWTHEQLASHLSLTVEELDRLGLAGRPRPDRFASDVRAIAQASGALDFQLMHVLRAVESRAAFTGSVAAQRIVAAARDHDEPEPEPDEPNHPSPEAHDRPEDNAK